VKWGACIFLLNIPPPPPYLGGEEENYCYRKKLKLMKGEEKENVTSKKIE